MNVTLPWKLPYPSCQLMGPDLNNLGGGKWALEFQDEPHGPHDRLVFSGVCGVKFNAFDDLVQTDFKAMYDTLIDLGETNWLRSIRASTISASHKLRHMAIVLDGEETSRFEFVCESSVFESALRE